MFVCVCVCASARACACPSTCKRGMIMQAEIQMQPTSSGVPGSAHALLLEDDGRAVFEKWQGVTKFRATPLEIYTSTKVPESPVDFSCPLCSSINEFLHLCIFLVVPFLRVAGGRLRAVWTAQMLQILPKRICWIAQSIYNTSTLFPRCCIFLALSSFTCLHGCMRWNQA